MKHAHIAEVKCERYPFSRHVTASYLFSLGLLSLGVLAGGTLTAMADDWQTTVAAAEQEGKVTVISPPVPTHRATLERFKEAYPKIKLEISGLAPSDIDPRLDAERKAGIYNWDVMVSGASPTSYTMYLPKGWLVPIKDVILPENQKDNLWLAGFDAGFLDKGKQYLLAFQAARPRVIFINRSIVPESQLNSLADLTKPEWKGKITMFDPRVGGPGGSVAAQLLLALGKEKMSAFFQDQALVLSTTPRQMVEWVVRGTYPIGLGLIDRDLTDFQSKGLGLDVKSLDVPIEYQAVNQQWGAVFLFNNAPHPNAAKVFINWLLSQEVQSDWAKRSQSNSRRLDVPPGDPANVVDVNTWLHGINMSAEAQLQLRMETNQILNTVLK